MLDPTRQTRVLGSDPADIGTDLAELCRQHGVGLDLVESSRDIDDLIDRVVGDYEQRSAHPSGDPTGPDGGPSGKARHDLRAIVAFACRASVLRERATASAARSGRDGGDDVSRSDDAARIVKLEDLLASIGVLIHKINNPLTALVGRSQLLRMQSELPPKVLHAAEVIEESSRRIAELTRELGSKVKEGRQVASGPAPAGDGIATSSGDPAC